MTALVNVAEQNTDTAKHKAELAKLQAKQRYIKEYNAQLVEEASKIQDENDVLVSKIKDATADEQSANQSLTFLEAKTEVSKHQLQERLKSLRADAGDDLTLEVMATGFLMFTAVLGREAAREAQCQAKEVQNDDEKRE